MYKENIMTKKSAVVLTLIGFGTHFAITALAHLGLSMSEGANCALYVGTPVVVTLFMLVYAALSKVKAIRMVVYGLAIVTGLFLFIVASEAMKGAIPEYFTAGNVFQFWLVNLLVWSPIALGAAAAILYIQQPKSTEQ